MTFKNYNSSLFDEDIQIGEYQKPDETYYKVVRMNNPPEQIVEHSNKPLSEVYHDTLDKFKDIITVIRIESK